MLSGTVLPVAESVPSFATGTALWPAALLLTTWPFFAYPFLVLTVAGWIWTVLKVD